MFSASYTPHIRSMTTPNLTAQSWVVLQLRGDKGRMQTSDCTMSVPRSPSAAFQILLSKRQLFVELQRMWEIKCPYSQHSVPVWFTHFPRPELECPSVLAVSNDRSPGTFDSVLICPKWEGRCSLGKANCIRILISLPLCNTNKINLSTDTMSSILKAAFWSPPNHCVIWLL